MADSQLPLGDGQRSLEQRLRFCVLALSTVERGQIVLARSRVRVAGSQLSLVDGQCPLIQRLRFCITPTLVEVESGLIEQTRRRRCRESILLDPDGTLLGMRHQTLTGGPVSKGDRRKGRIDGL